MTQHVQGIELGLGGVQLAHPRRPEGLVLLPMPVLHSPTLGARVATLYPTPSTDFTSEASADFPVTSTLKRSILVFTGVCKDHFYPQPAAGAGGLKC